MFKEVVLIFLKSKYFKFWQYLNILFIHLQLLVIKWLKFNFFKLLHPSNIDSISVTLEVSNVDKSKEVNELSPLNKSHITSTFGV